MLSRLPSDLSMSLLSCRSLSLQRIHRMKNRLVLGLGSLLLVGQTMAVDICVDTAGAGTSLDTAIQMLEVTQDPSNTLRLETGTHQASGFILEIPVNANLTIRGGYAPTPNHDCTGGHTPDPSLTMLNGGFPAAHALLVFGHGNNTLKIQALTFQNGTGGGGAGLVVSSFNAPYTGSVTIENNIFLNNIAQGEGGGLFANMDGELILRNNLFKGNSGSPAAAFLRASSNSTTFFSNNTFANNIVSPGDFVVHYDVNGTTPAIFTNNIFWGNNPNQAPNGFDIDVTQLLPDGQTLAHQFIDNDFQLVSTPAAVQGINGNVITDPLFVDAVNSNFRLKYGSPLI